MNDKERDTIKSILKDLIDITDNLDDLKDARPVELTDRLTEIRTRLIGYVMTGKNLTFMTSQCHIIEKILKQIQISHTIVCITS